MIVAFVNPRSRANRKNPRLAGVLAAALGDAGRVVTPRSLESLDEETRALAANVPSVVAVHGGDGTLHKTLTSMVRAFGERALPPIAILGGGTMNVVTGSLGIRVKAEPFLRALAARARENRPLETLSRRCLRVGDAQYGFVFANGVLANFLGEYYAGSGHGGPWRALWLMTRLALSGLVRGPFARRVFRRFHGHVAFDGKRLDISDLMAVGASTVREVGLGFKLFPRADDDPDRFAVLAIHAGVLSLVRDLPAVRFGRGIAPARARSDLGATLDVEAETPEDSAYTIDGDLYRAAGPLRVSVGPALRIVDPRAR